MVLCGHGPVVLGLFEQLEKRLAENGAKCINVS